MIAEGDMFQKTDDVESKKMENRRIEMLVKKAIGGNKDAFEEIVRLKTETIIFSSLNILGQYHDAEDATQEVILKMYKYIKNLKDPSAFHAWLQRIIINQCYLIQNKKKKKKETVGMDEMLIETIDEDREFLPQSSAENKEQRLMIRKIIKNLPEKRRIIVSMYYYDELSYKDIAYALNMPFNSVASELKRAKKTIKEEIEKTESLNMSEVSKFATVPVLSQVLNEQASEIIPKATIDKMIAYTKGSVFSKAMSGKTIISIISSVIICTALITISALNFLDPRIDNDTPNDRDVISSLSESGKDIQDNNSSNKNSSLKNNSENKANKELENKEDSINKIDPSNPSPSHAKGQLDFIGGDCDCGHVNPNKVEINISDSKDAKVTWNITKIKNNKVVYQGTGTSISKELKSLKEKKKDGTYIISVNYENSNGNKVALTRYFMIYSGRISPNQFE